MHLIYSSIGIYVDGYPVKTEDRNFYIPKETNYSIFIKNTSQNTCNYKITIDERVIGTWRLRHDESIDIQRPIHSNERFFFIDKHQEPSLYNRKTGVMVVDEELCQTQDFLEADSVDGLETDGVGATVLKGKFSQRFTSACHLESKLVGVFFFGMKLAKWRLL